MSLTTWAAWWFLPFVLPICVYTSYTDLSRMKITNQTVIVLGMVFLVVGLVALPLPEYGARVLQLVIVLVVTFLLATGGAMGAGDAKFIAAAAPFIHPGDIRLVVALLAAALLGAVATHRLAKYTPLRTIAPHWESWDKGKKFPMGLALSGTLGLYLILAIFFGS